MKKVIEEAKRFFRELEREHSSKYQYEYRIGSGRSVIGSLSKLEKSYIETLEMVWKENKKKFKEGKITKEQLEKMEKWILQTKEIRENSGYLVLGESPQKGIRITFTKI
ncbi:hypothetical protein [Bacillus badius]|uniref:hypothetical protein n=1 Tax=Bacillus badius TaxID=1455 RepID=UPI0007B368A9|nr:hypothetical protein [Bacillus badius]KZR59350.1 hypothetical protein A3781_13190 [Bacillus badius]